MCRNPVLNGKTKFFNDPKQGYLHYLTLFLHINITCGLMFMAVLNDCCLQCFDTVGQQELGDGRGGHCLVRMEWRAGWSVCLPLLIFPCTIKSRSSLLALAHPGGPGKRAVNSRVCV